MNTENIEYENLLRDLRYFTKVKNYQRAIETIDEIKALSLTNSNTN